MLERVTLGQTRFAMPGVTTDARGVVLGKLGALLFPSIDGAVGWLRLYGDEESLDDLLPQTQILKLRTTLATRALLVLIPAATTYILDRAARCARLAGGATYTGTTRHFVRYRDEHSPCGYDVVDLGVHAAAAEIVLHGEDGAQDFARDGAIDVRALVLRLTLRRVPGSERLDAEARALLYLAVARGLGHGLVRYLLRNRVRAEAALIDLPPRSAFAGPEDPDGYLLLKVQDLPERLLAGLGGVPGVTRFRPVGEHVLVEVGYRHPIALASVASLFAQGRLHLFWGRRDRVDVVAGPITFSAAEHLTSARFAAEAPDRPATARVPEAPIGVEVRLLPTLAPPRRVVATLVEWSEVERLKKLVYALPPAALAGHRLAVTERGLLLSAPSAGLELIPLGTLLTEAAPRLLVPLGMAFVPRVQGEVLAAALAPAGTAPGAQLVVFPAQGPPFSVPDEAFAPLERRVLARVPLAPVAIAELGAEAASPGPRVVNDPAGRFALWGFKNPR